MSVLQQRATIKVGSGPASPVYLPGKLLERGTALNVHVALDQSFPELSTTSLNTLANSSRWCFVGLLGDAVAANEAVFTEWAKAVPGAVVDAGRCRMHQGHLCFAGATHRLNLSSPLHCLGCAIKNGGNQDKLERALARVAKLVNIWYEPPPPDAAGYSNCALDVTPCDFEGYHSLEDEVRRGKVRLEMQRIRALVLHVLNSRWWEPLVHYCWSAAGTPCCGGEAVAHGKVIEVF